jgi:hypothetical protein
MDRPQVRRAHVEKPRAELEGIVRRYFHVGVREMV